MRTNHLARMGALAILFTFSVIMLIAASHMEPEQRFDFSIILCLTSPYVISLILTAK